MLQSVSPLVAHSNHEILASCLFFDSAMGNDGGRIGGGGGGRGCPDGCCSGCFRS